MTASTEPPRVGVLPTRVSVIMPVFNGLATLCRAITSVQRQDFSSWELLCVDDRSTDRSLDALTKFSEVDNRIRVLRSASNAGPGAARNLGLQHAHGDMIAYLDCDDEYYPDYLGKVDRFGGIGDVLVFRYDAVFEGRPNSIRTWDPGSLRNFLFLQNPSAPIGVSHRRELLTRSGMFNASLWILEDWDLWRRLARTGAEFLYLPFRSGIYHVRQNSISRTPHITPSQRAQYLSRRLVGNAREQGLSDDPIRRCTKVLHASPHCLLDCSRGATAAAQMITLLSHCGFNCLAYCSDYLNEGSDETFPDLLGRLDVRCEVRNSMLDGHLAEVIYGVYRRVPVTIVRTDTSNTRSSAYAKTINAFLAFYEKTLDSFAPDAIVVHGEDPLSQIMTNLAKRRDIAVVVAVDETPRGTPSWIAEADYVFSNDKYLAEKYLVECGVLCNELPRAINWDSGVIQNRQGRDLTILGESALAKRIADRITQRNCAIPIRFAGTSQAGHTEALKDCLASTNVLLIVDRWECRLSDVALTAMANSIPVLAEDRGGFPELIEMVECLITRRFCPEYPAMLYRQAEDVEPWCDAVIDLWDYPQVYRKAVEIGLARANRSKFDAVRPTVEFFFQSVQSAPGPPVLPKACGSISMSVPEMIDLIRCSPPYDWPAGWPHWENVKQSHRQMASEFIECLPSVPAGYAGRGIVIAGGGRAYFPGAWVCIRMLRKLGCQLPIQLWYLGENEVDSKMKEIMAPFDVHCVDALSVAEVSPCRILDGWALKPYMIKHCPYKDVILIDADNVPVRDPTFLFESSEYRNLGAILWPDFHVPGSPDVRHCVSPAIWETFGISPRDETPIESGQLVVDKHRYWRELNLCLWYTEHADWTYAHVYGDKECFHISWRRCGSDYAIPSAKPIWIEHTVVQHDFEGNRLFQHRCSDKWALDGNNRANPNLEHEEDCFCAL